jgi:cytochrome c oxidase subunit 3
VATALPDIEERSVPTLGYGEPPLGGDVSGADWEPWHPERRRQSTYTIGMLVAVAASSMFFLALISASVVHKGLAGNSWMPLQLPSILWLNSCVAIASSVTLFRARQLFKRGAAEGFSRWWSVTVVLGMCFLGGQFFAWRQLAASGFYMRSNPSVSFFYVFTVAHGLHLLGGVIALLWIKYRRSPIVGQRTATSVAALYWHFVTGLWLFLFSFFLLGD